MSIFILQTDLKKENILFKTKQKQFILNKIDTFKVIINPV